jgi:cytosine/uracil/thiamine/allantoin permease
VAVWSGIFVADVAMRRKSYKEDDLFRSEGVYGAWNINSILLMIMGTIIGWGFVTNNFAPWLSWQGYLLGLIGGRDGNWGYANLGVLIALAIGFLGYLLFSFKKVRQQESSIS